MTGSGSTRAAALALALACVGLLGATPRSAPLRIRAMIEPANVAVGQEAKVTVIAEASGVSIPDFTLPPVRGLKIIRVTDAQSFSWVNGKLSRSTTSLFLVSASAPGRYTIPPIRLAAGAARAETAPLLLNVEGTGAAPVPGGPPVADDAPPRVWGDQSLPELLVRLETDRTRAYWNQQIVARYVFYTRAQLDESPSWEIAESPGFWREALGDLKRTRVRMGGAEYVAFEQAVAYFPTRTGRLPLGVGRVEARVVRGMDAPDPWGLLGLPDARIETIPLQTETVRIDVQPLPPGAPSGFRGAVGTLAMDVKVDRFVARAGEPVTVTTILSGKGNLNAAGDPEVTATLPLRSFEAGGSVTTARAGAGVRSERRHETTFIPEVPGSFAIAPIRFTWFDPEEERYRTLLSDSIRIAVIAGDGSTAARAGPVEPPAALRTGSGPTGPLALGPPRGATVLAGGSLAALAGVFVAAHVRRRADLDPRRRRHALLRRHARSVRDLARSSSRPAAAARALPLLVEGLGARYGADVEGRPREETLRIAGESGAPEPVLEEVRGVIAALERQAFAPEVLARDPSTPDALESAGRLLDRWAEERS